MHRRQPPIPRLWLMTDSRMGDALWDALGRLPRGSGVVFRHYDLPLAERRRLFARVAQIARRRGLVLLRAGDVPLGRGEDGVHGHGRMRRPGVRTRSAHSRAEAIAAIRAGADVVFVSPLFATRSHPGAPGLGRVGAALMIRGLDLRAVALGGVNARRARGLDRLGFYGWAGIDAWTRDQKRKAVPI
jgi:thiamine-phosphate pyrophosphorylase